VSTEALLLALSTVIRPTAVAAVFAILATRSPHRLLLAYVAAGVVFTLTVGTLAVLLLAGLASATSSAAPRPILDLVLGGLALGYAGGAWAGWVPRRRERPPDSPGRMQRRLASLTPRGAAAAGVLTHLPGLVYLAALNAIAGSTRGHPVDAIVQVAVYVAIWFSLPLLTLVLSARKPGLPQELLELLGAWTRRHRRVITVVTLGVLGGYLTVSGVVDLTAVPTA
jgi:hypothetical protein